MQNSYFEPSPFSMEKRQEVAQQMAQSGYWRKTQRLMAPMLISPERDPAETVSALPTPNASKISAIDVPSPFLLPYSGSGSSPTQRVQDILSRGIHVQGRSETVTTRSPQNPSYSPLGFHQESSWLSSQLDAVEQRQELYRFEIEVQEASQRELWQETFQSEWKELQIQVANTPEHLFIREVFNFRSAVEKLQQRQWQQLVNFGFWNWQLTSLVTQEQEERFCMMETEESSYSQILLVLRCVAERLAKLPCNHRSTAMLFVGHLQASAVTHSTTTEIRELRIRPQQAIVPEEERDDDWTAGGIRCQDHGGRTVVLATEDDDLHFEPPEKKTKEEEWNKNDNQNAKEIHHPVFPEGVLNEKQGEEKQGEQRGEKRELIIVHSGRFSIESSNNEQEETSADTSSIADLLLGGREAQEVCPVTKPPRNGTGWSSTEEDNSAPELPLHKKVAEQRRPSDGFLKRGLRRAATPPLSTQQQIPKQGSTSPLLSDEQLPSSESFPSVGAIATPFYLYEEEKHPKLVYVKIYQEERKKEEPMKEENGAIPMLSWALEQSGCNPIGKVKLSTLKEIVEGLEGFSSVVNPALSSSSSSLCFTLVFTSRVLSLCALSQHTYQLWLKYFQDFCVENCLESPSFNPAVRIEAEGRTLVFCYMTSMTDSRSVRDHCRQMALYLHLSKVNYEEIDVAEKGFIRQRLVKLTGSKSSNIELPLLFVGEQFIGDFEIVQNLVDDGKLLQTLEATGYHSKTN